MVRRVLVTESVHDDALQLLRCAGFAVSGPGAPLAPADALLVRLHKLSAQQVADYAVISKHGVGVDNIPLAAAAAAGVVVMNTPGANAGAVAEQSLLLMLALARAYDAQRAAANAGAPPPHLRGLEGLRLLVVGFGASGQKLAGLGRALGMAVTVHSRSLLKAQNAGFSVADTLAQGLQNADVVSLHCPLSDKTRGLLNAQTIGLLPKGALIVNCARGGLIEDAALIDALNCGHLGGAGLDVTATEPLPQDHPLRQAKGVILTPHAAAMSDGAFRRMGLMAAQNIIDHFAGCPDPAHVVIAAPPP